MEFSFNYCSNLAWDDLTTLQVQVDKENLIEFSCISCILLIHLLLGLCAYLPQSHNLLECSITWHIMCHLCHIHHHLFVTLSHYVTAYLGKKRKRKENRNKWLRYFGQVMTTIHTSALIAVYCFDSAPWNWPIFGKTCVRF